MITISFLLLPDSSHCCAKSPSIFTFQKKKSNYSYFKTCNFLLLVTRSSLNSLAQTVRTFTIFFCSLGYSGIWLFPQIFPLVPYGPTTQNYVNFFFNTSYNYSHGSSAPITPYAKSFFCFASLFRKLQIKDPKLEKRECQKTMFKSDKIYIEPLVR